jgi:hypothetical protein
LESIDDVNRLRRQTLYVGGYTEEILEEARKENRTRKSA